MNEPVMIRTKHKNVLAHVWTTVSQILNVVASLTRSRLAWTRRSSSNWPSEGDALPGLLPAPAEDEDAAEEGTDADSAEGPGTSRLN